MARRMLVEYEIRSGRTVERRRSMMVLGGRWQEPQHRGKKAKESTAKKLAANEQEAVRKLARILNCNFGRGDLFLTLKFDNDHVPADWDAGYVDIAAFFRAARQEAREKLGKPLRYVWAPGKVDMHTGEITRPHVHIVMDRLSWESISTLWDRGEVSYRLLDGSGDYTAIARYMIGNAGAEKGKRSWNTSRGLEKPIYTEPVVVMDDKEVKAPRGAVIRERSSFTDEESGRTVSYVRYVKPLPEKKRGGRKKEAAPWDSE